MKRPALLIAGHGSRDEQGAQEFRDFVELAQQTRPDIDVAGGFIELSPPAIAIAAQDLVERGNRDIVVVPLMLLAAGHTKGDIPATIERERQRHPGVRFRYGRDLGIHPTILRLLDDRILEATSGEPAGMRAIFVGRGSSDPDANADVAKIARLLLERHDFLTADVAYRGITTPLLPEVLERSARLGPEPVLVIPHFLFTGVLERRIRSDVDAFLADRPQARVSVARYLGVDPDLAGLVLQRYEEVLDGDPRMNCDMCAYRVRFPGLEDRVGAPAFPHDHPDEGGHHHHGGHVHREPQEVAP